MKGTVEEKETECKAVEKAMVFTYGKDPQVRAKTGSLF